MSIELMINGERRALSCNPMTPLIEVLRDLLGMTGGKDVCGEGFCGACTVHMNGEAVMSCLLPVARAANATITTIEGASQNNLIAALQNAFVTVDAVQCGMCFPGMVMSLSAFLAENPAPTESEVRGAMAGNICRCTGYERIVEAVLSVMAREEVTQ